MALSLDTVITVATLVKGAVDLYNRIDDWPDQMKKLGRRMKNLDVYLSELQEIVATRPNSAFMRLFSTQKKHLGLLIQDIRRDTKTVEGLFHKWENDIGPLGFQFRFKTLTQAYFALGSSSDKITALIEDMNEHLQGIRDYLILMGFKAAVLIGERQNANTPQVPVLGKPAKTLPNGHKDNSGKEKRKPSPSPSPAPPRRNLTIIFVDSANVARSVVGEALCKLLREWTEVSKGDWRVRTIHSAGLRVRNNTDFPDVESVKRDVAGGIHPNCLALDAVFDNKNFDFPAKKDVHIAMLKKKSNGIKKDIFKQYDFILVFTSRDYENMLKIKSALVEKEGIKEVTAKGKGRILHLGSYLTLDGIPREIENPKGGEKEPNGTRADWNWKAAQIKLAVKEFLKQEMQWKQPTQKALERRMNTDFRPKLATERSQTPAKVENKKVLPKKDVDMKQDRKIARQEKHEAHKATAAKLDGKPRQQKVETKEETGNKPQAKQDITVPDQKPISKKPAAKISADKKPQTTEREDKDMAQKKSDQKKRNENVAPEKKLGANKAVKPKEK